MCEVENHFDRVKTCSFQPWAKGSNDQYFQNKIFDINLFYIKQQYLSAFLPYEGLYNKTFRKLKKCSNIVASLQFVHKKDRPTSKNHGKRKFNYSQIICPILMILSKLVIIAQTQMLL